MANFDFKAYQQILNSFQNVFFQEDNHTYYIDGKESSYSATRILKKWTPEFESEKLAKKVADKQGVLIEDVLEKWEFEKNYSCFKGTIIHEYIENFLDRKYQQINPDQIKLFLKKYDREPFLIESLEDIRNHIFAFKKFYNWWKEDHILIKSELVIGDSRAGGIGGTIDNLSYNTKTNQLVIFDYKTNKEVRTKNKYKQTLLHPFQHLDNCELVKYSLQLLIYKKIIEDNTGLKIESNNCNIIWFSKNQEYKLYKILPLEKETENIFSLI